MVDVEYIKSIIQEILNKTFSDPRKRSIHDFEDRINFSCPVCLDSRRTASKKRGNIYFDNLLFICFRCGAKIPLSTLCKDNMIQLDPIKKLEMIEHIKSNTHVKHKSELTEIDFSELIDLNILESHLAKGDEVLTDFKPVYAHDLVYNYLVERGIGIDLHKDIYQAKHWVSATRYEPVVVFLNRKENKVLGMQTRNLKSGKYREFKIYNFETIYKWVHTEEEYQNLDMEQMAVYNKLSYFFNILNIDFESTITVFEGYLDSLFYPNSIGITGVSTDMSVLENANIDLQYFYDNDEAGFTKSEQKIKNGFKVFLWKKLFQDIVDRKNSPDPYSLLHRISKVKDLNKLSQSISNPYEKLSLYNFFSKDAFDIKWIPKQEKKRISKLYKNEIYKK